MSVAWCRSRVSSPSRSSEASSPFDDQVAGRRDGFLRAGPGDEPGHHGPGDRRRLDQVPDPLAAGHRQQHTPQQRGPPRGDTTARPRRRTPGQANPAAAVARAARVRSRFRPLTLREPPPAVPCDRSAAGSETGGRHERGSDRHDQDQHPSADGPAALVPVALAGRPRARHGVDPRRARGHHRRLDRQPADREGSAALASRRARSASLPASTSPAPASAPCSSAT